MAAQKYEIVEAFRYTASTPEGDVAGEFEAGVTGELTDEQVSYLEAFAVPAGLATRVDDAPAPKVPAKFAPVPPPAPQEPAPAPSDTQEQAQ